MDKIDTGPILVDPVTVEHPVPFKDGYPTQDDRYNTATKFNIKAVFEDGLELTIRDDTDNGIIFEGTEGRIFVNRGRPLADRLRSFDRIRCQMVRSRRSIRIDR